MLVRASYAGGRISFQDNPQASARTFANQTERVGLNHLGARAPLPDNPCPPAGMANYGKGFTQSVSKPYLIWWVRRYLNPLSGKASHLQCGRLVPGQHTHITIQKQNPPFWLIRQIGGCRKYKFKRQ